METDPWTGIIRPLADGADRTKRRPWPRSLRLDRLYLKQASAVLDLALIGLSLAANVVGKAEIRRRLRQRATAAALRRWSRAIGKA